ncbi:BrnT family toxin [Stenotrophomonas maltophilia]|uniref:BrnT family toxin n=1 Tax=Stenotrophomonas lactitubi TaxID=2045214 RepID=UPI00204177FE|nr:BrnT family toxin [Stenotrophomonas lactitubi]MCO7472533.1 BrnT family toxin [Stenotrophomonas maltophilia]
MEITYDAAKNARNVEERGLSFELVRAFDFQTALFVVDDRKEYGEVRYRGLVGERVHALVFTETAGGIRVISFRKANKREVKSYEQAQEQRDA